MAIVNIVAEGGSGYDAYLEILNAIRYRVNNAYEASDIPNNVIENRIFLGQANTKLETRVPNWESLTDAQKQRLQDAVIDQTAIELLISELRIKSEDVEGERVGNYDSLGIKNAISMLQANVDGIVGELVAFSGLFLSQFVAVNPKKRF